MDAKKLFKEAVEHDVTDIFVVAGAPLAFKIRGNIGLRDDNKLMPEKTKELIEAIYILAERDTRNLSEKGDDDFSFSIPKVGRFRVNTYKQRGSQAAVIRVVQFELPHIETLGIPKQIIDLYKRTKGLVLVTGPAGSGKSTTLSCIIDQINKTRTSHVITLEDPIEFIHKHNKSIVSQREIGTDTASYVQGLRAALREAPDVILLGEMRDFETINIAMTAAETGQLVLGTLHTLGAANTVDRIIDVFPANQQQQIRTQLSMVLQAIVSQQLIPGKDGAVLPVFEIVFVNSAIRNMIRESKMHQIDSVIFAAKEEGMCNMDGSIIKLYQEGKITGDNAIAYSINHEAMRKKIGE
ncbi:type IV pili twitching motility protein PilT [Sporanaerobium hydrogeniformans]|uniref:Type IV pili twitching motility protein PilT n=1 Tax=Sporanaerobium hydrogeniformans TaxID=3072179 RepID=A0AC61DB75_9FIRM|nr:PilT/PilU family type 4a pilus ATPase [Sporanaerobium hydrogeniformans]PHV70471.1 type IV pili twitching motility protein PilT [Sporanaerobium hydrogeniformans]